MLCCSICIHFTIINMTSSISCKRFMEKINDDDDDDVCAIRSTVTQFIGVKI